MNAAGCYHGLPGEQDDPLEASLEYGMGIYAKLAHADLPHDHAREGGIANKAVPITRRIMEFRCADGWIGIVLSG